MFFDHPYSPLLVKEGTFILPFARGGSQEGSEK